MLRYSFLCMIISYARLCALFLHFALAFGRILLSVACMLCLSLQPCQNGSSLALTFTPVIFMTFEFCQRGATVDTPFLTDLKTQTSPIERLVMLYIVLVQKFQSLDYEPCLRTSRLFHTLSRFANQARFSLFLFPKGGRGLVDHLSVAVGYVS